MPGKSMLSTDQECLDELILSLTREAWLEQETVKVKSILLQALGGVNGKEGKSISDLRIRLSHLRIDYDDVDLVAICNRLIADCTIEVVGRSVAAECCEQDECDGCNESVTPGSSVKQTIWSRLKRVVSSMIVSKHSTNS